MFKGFRKNCRDECVANMDNIYKGLQTAIEYFQVAVDNNDKDAMKKWMKIIESDIGDYRSNLTLFRWMLQRGNVIINIESLIDKAGELNATITANKKELDSLKKEIKSKNLSKISGSKYVAEVSERVATSFDEDKLLTKVKEVGANWLLKEVVDEDKLEESIVKGELEAEQFNDCIIEKVSQVLKFKKVKGVK